MTKKQAEKLKPGDKVIPRYCAYEINLYGSPDVEMVAGVRFDHFNNEYYISFAGGGGRYHRSTDLVKTSHA